MLGCQRIVLKSLNLDNPAGVATFRNYLYSSICWEDLGQISHAAFSNVHLSFLYIVTNSLLSQGIEGRSSEAERIGVRCALRPASGERGYRRCLLEPEIGIELIAHDRLEIMA
jgi:hypothetical protein